MENNKYFGLSEIEFRKAVVDTSQRHGFYMPGFQLYSAVAGFYELGPPGVLLKDNIINFWKKHFVLEETMLPLETSIVTPEVVFQSSGHVDRFTDIVVKDLVTGETHRADHLLRDYCTNYLNTCVDTGSAMATELQKLLDVIGDISTEEMGSILQKYDIRAPETKNRLSEPYNFGLMFGTYIGTSGTARGYLRPETAQGTFINFKRLYHQNGEKLPFAAAQIGRVFRNEASSKHGLLRVREFTLAEIEHFLDPEDKSHMRFSEVSDLEILMLPRDDPPIRLSLGEAVLQKKIGNQTLAYYIGRSYLFLSLLGINKDRVRFRQHREKEMAHYACDCWDAEIECNYGWIECIGIADRGSFDLTVHADKSGHDLTAKRKLAEPKVVETLTVQPNKMAIGQAFKGEQSMILDSLMGASEEDAMNMLKDLEDSRVEYITRDVCGKTVRLEKNMLKVTSKRKRIEDTKFMPHVIEPSFGIGRIFYILLEHLFCISLDDGRESRGFRFSPVMAPYKCYVIPFRHNQKAPMDDAALVSRYLTAAGIYHKLDVVGGELWNKYSRARELGALFAIVVKSSDFVTIRERDSSSSIVVKAVDVALIVKDIIEGVATWEETCRRHTYIAGKQNEAVDQVSGENVKDLEIKAVDQVSGENVKDLEIKAGDEE